MQDLKASIAAKSGTEEEQSIKLAERVPHTNDLVEWKNRLLKDLANNCIQMAHLLDHYVPDWRERVTLSMTPPPPIHDPEL